MTEIIPILAEIDVQKSHLDVLRRSLDNKKIKEALSLEFLYESNRIEGNTLTLRETQMVHDGHSNSEFNLYIAQRVLASLKKYIEILT